MLVYDVNIREIGYWFTKYRMPVQINQFEQEIMEKFKILKLINKTQAVKYERLHKTMCTFSAYVAFNKSTNGQTDITHANDEHFSVFLYLSVPWWLCFFLVQIKKRSCLTSLVF